MAVLASLAFLILAAVSGLLAYVVRRGTVPEVSLAAAGGQSVPFRPAARARWDPGPVRLAVLLAIVAVSVGASAYFTSTSGFYGDDFINFRELQLEGGLSFHYLVSPTSAHFAPGHRLGDWFLDTVAPLNFSFAQVLLLVGFAASLLLFHRLLSELFEPGPAVLVLTFLYGASTVHVAVHQWWASGLDRVPATCFTFLSILGYVRYHRTGSRPWLGVSVVALLAALLFYVKPVLIPLYLVLFRLLLLRPDEPVRVSLAGALREWRVWLLYVAPVALYSIVYLRQYESGRQFYGPSLARFGRYFTDLWFRVVAPGAFGLYVSKDNGSALVIAGLVAVQLAIVAGVVWTIARRPAAWRAWVFLGVALVANALLVGLTRIGYFGPRYVAYVLFYNLEILYLSLIAVGAAVLGVRRSLHAPPVLRPPSNVLAGRWALVAAGLAGYLALAWAGSHRVSQADVWPGRDARPYVDRVKDSLERVEGLTTVPVFVDGVVPKPVIHPLGGPWTSHSEVFPVIDDDARFDVRGRELFEVGANGAARPVTFVAEGGDDMANLLRLGAVGFDAPVADVRDDGVLCVTSGAKSSVVAVGVPAGAGGPHPYALVRYSSRKREVAALITEPMGGGRLSEPRYVMLKGREQESVFTLPPRPLQRLYVVLSARGQMCVSRVEVGRLDARP